MDKVKEDTLYKNRISNKQWIPYFVLAGLTIFFCWWFVGQHGIFGAKVDWISQHSVLPDYFRQQFYATGNLFPEFAANLGGGQNVYHYAYYGLYSPLILPSYLLPFVKMPDYIMAVSIIGLIASVLLFYHWMLGKKVSGSICFITSVLFLLAGPMIGQYSGQIMFVDYMPFLCLALMGVDRYFERKRSGLMAVSIFLMILTSFYFSIGGMLVLVIYGMHRYFEQREGYRITVTIFLLDGLRFVCPMLLAVLMSSFFLVPTALALTGGRSNGEHISLLSLFIPQLPVERFVYSFYGIGLTTLVITVLITGLLYKKLYERILTYGCVIVLVIPVFAYLLNGGLYIRDKVFIPFLPLVCYLIAVYLEKCKNDKISLAEGAIPYIITIAFMYMERNRFTKEWIGKALIAESLLFMLCYFFYYVIKKYKKQTKEVLLLAMPSVLCLVVTMNTFYQNKPDRYVSREMYDNITRKEKEQAVKKIQKEDTGYYRMEQIGTEDENAADLNRIWDIGQNITSIYSSAYNSEYQEFRQKTFGLEEPFRNIMMQSVSKNPVFQRMMGVKYIVSDSDVPGYTLYKQKKGTKIYRNEDASPVGYATSRVLKEEEYKNLAFPYNQTAFLEYAVVSGNAGKYTGKSPEQPELKAYEPVLLQMTGQYGMKIREEKEGYKIHLKKTKKTEFIIQKNTSKSDDGDRVLFLRFKVKNHRPDKDVAIWVNGVRNKLTARDHIYYNGNKLFTYAIPLKDGSDTISISFGSGKYEIKNVRAYMGTLPEKSENLYQAEWNVDRKQTKGNQIQGNIDVKEDGYFITSIPYDSHFKIRIDGKETDIQKVNTAFLGCQIQKGTHKVQIIYHAPGARAGKIVSVIGILGLLLMLEGERRKWKICEIYHGENIEKYRKNKEEI